MSLFAMFFVLSKLLIYLTKPFVILCLLLILTFIVKNKRWKKWLRIGMLIVFFITSNGIIISEIMRAWEIPAVRMDELKDTYEVGIVLGGGADVDRQPNDRLFIHKSGERILHAAQLYKEGKIKKILYTGGRGEIFEDPEADNKTIIDFYLDCGIPREDIVIESLSKNTRENALFTAKLVDKSKKHLLITSAFHMRRSLACYEKVGLRVVPFSCDFNTPKEEDRFSVTMIIPSVEAMGAWEILLKEWVGMMAYKAAGYI